MSFRCFENAVRCRVALFREGRQMSHVFSRRCELWWIGVHGISRGFDVAWLFDVSRIRSDVALRRLEMLSDVKCQLRAPCTSDGRVGILFGQSSYEGATPICCFS